MEQAKKLIVDHLTSVGYPNIEPQKVFDELPKIWAILKENNLAPDITFPMFQQVVVQAYNQKVMQIQMEEQYLRASKPPIEKVKCTVVK